MRLDHLTLAPALDTLPERGKTILQPRYFRSMSQRQTAEIIEISQMHVSRLERAALNKLRLVLQHNSNVNLEEAPARTNRVRGLARVS